MNKRIAIAAVLIAASAARAGEPILKLEMHEPLSQVNATAFAPDGKLYTAGFDKVVRGWKLGDRGWAPAGSHRVPIGPGMAGVLNDVAISDDGKWLATGGVGWFKKMADFRSDGVLLGRNALDKESLLEIGAVRVFDRATNESFALLHHQGPVVALAFDGTTLATMAWEFPEVATVGEYTLAIWDLQTRRLVATISLKGPPPLGFRPAFTVKRLGFDPQNSAVVATFRGAEALVWRPTLAKDWQSVRVFDNATCAVRGPGATALVGCRVGEGRNVAACFVQIALDQPELAASIHPLNIGAQPGDVILSASSNANADALAYILRSKASGRDSLFAARKGDAAPTFHKQLNPGESGAPAISADGMQVSIAPLQGGSFWVQSLSNPNAPPVPIVGKGVKAGSSRFVEKGGELGLQFSVPQAGADPLKVLLDPVKFVLTTNLQGWREADHQVASGVTIQKIDDSTLQCTTGLGIATVRLEKAFATVSCGARPNGQAVPLAAVASVDVNGQVELRIYRADTGELLRRCSAHTARIDDLSVSDDGGLLLSTARDRTVAMWNLADLKDVIDKVGELDAVKIDGDRRVVESKVPGLQVGDMIVGRVQGDAGKPFKSAIDVYAAARSMKPGSTMPVFVERNGQQFQAALPIAQGKDERKPLMQCYCRDSGQWIAWSPFGPYDSNSESAEDWIGWHFNPEGNAPVRFALGAQHRKEYRRTGLLRRLLQTRSLTAALESWRRLDAEPPDPSISLSIAAIDKNRTDATVVKTADVEVAMKITNKDFPLERLASINATIGEQAIKLEQVSPTEYRGRTKLPGLGKHRLRMTASTKAPLPRLFEDERTIVFAPPKPTLKPTEAWVGEAKAAADANGVWRLPNQEAESVLLKAALAADPAFQLATTISINGEVQAGPVNLNELRVPLRIGENRIVVSTAPKTEVDGIDAKAGFVVNVRRNEPPRTYAPPTIAFERLEIGPAGDPVSIPASGSMTIGRSAVRVVANVKSEEPIAVIEADGAALPPGQTQVAFNRVLKLGSNRIRLSAQGKSGVKSSQEIDVTLKPSMPKVAVETAKDAKDLRWNGSPLKTNLVVRFEATPERFPLEAKIKRNGVVVGQAQRTTDDPSQWTYEAAVEPGENRFTVDFESGWAKETSGTAAVMVRRPPILVGAKTSAVGTSPFVDLTAEVQALDGFLPTEMTINGRVHHEIEMSKRPAPDANGATIAVMTAKRVPLVQGRNDFTVTVRNSEGESSAASVKDVVFTPPPPPLAAVTWIKPAKDGVQDGKDLDVKLRIESTTPIASAAMTIGGETKILPVQPAAGLDGVYEIDRRLELKPGRTALSLRVLNGGGETFAEERVATYTPPPAVLRLTALASNGVTVPSTRAADGSAAFGAVDSGRQTLVGELAFNDAKSADLSAPAKVRIMVNGLQQLTAELGPAKDGVRRFEASLILTQPEENRLYAQVEGLSIDSDCNLQGSVQSCAKPFKKRLHLVLIGVDEKNEAKLQADAAEALKECTNSASGNPAFESVKQSYSVCGHVTVPMIREAVDKLREDLADQAHEDVGNVVWFYFRGPQSIEKRRLMLMTSEPDWMPQSKFDAGELATRFDDIPGAQLLGLDVFEHEGSEGRSAMVQPFNRPNAALLEFRRPRKSEPVLFAVVGKAIPNVGRLGKLREAIETAKLPTGSVFDPLMPQAIRDLVVTAN
jgi:WD40 repeat protein